MIAMLTETVTSITACGERSVAELQKIEQRIACASRTDDLGGLKASLAKCLQAVRQEAYRQRAEPTEAPPV